MKKTGTLIAVTILLIVIFSIPTPENHGLQAVDERLGRDSAPRVVKGTSSFNPWGSMIRHSEAAEDEPLKLTLSEVFRLAGERNVRVIVANERVEQAIAQIGENRSVFLPQLNGSVSQLRQTRDLRASGFPSPTGQDLIGPFNAFDARIKITQTLFDPASFDRLKAAKENKNLSEAEGRKVKQDILVLAATLFIEARLAGQNKHLNQILVKRSGKHQEVATTKHHSGTATVLELKEAKADHAQTVYRYEASRAGARSKRLDLLALLGLPSEQQVIFDDSEILAQEEFPAEDKLSDLLRGQPDMEAALKGIDEEKLNLASEKNEYWPKISTFADYGPSGHEPGNTNETYTLGVQATLPFFEGGLRQARIKEAESLVKENEALAFDTRLTVQKNILSAIDSVRETLSLLDSKNAEFEVAEDHLQKTKQRVKNGSGSPLDLIDAEAEMTSAQYGKEEAYAAYVLSRIKLARSVGNVESILQNN